MCRSGLECGECIAEYNTGYGKELFNCQASTEIQDECGVCSGSGTLFNWITDNSKCVNDCEICEQTGVVGFGGGFKCKEDPDCN